ncbi:hypothetical protein OG742_23890 [Streptomyces sp. NBC_00828]|uniref:RipA family octameric membrane protein n=1 Tax=Streptomyces sp. NBC_00828 TaxID=2903678 RepID=UPI003865E096
MPEPRNAPSGTPVTSSVGDGSEAAREPSKSVLELYKLAVEMADRISARRGQANVFFLSIQTAFVSVIGVSLSNLRQEPWWAAPVLALAGVAISMTWWMQLRSYRELNRAKFAVINAIEMQFPVKVFTDEWGHLTRTREISRRARYAELGFGERVIPWIFVLVHALLCLGRLLT